MRSPTSSLAARLRSPLAYLGFWTLVGLFFASETYLAGVVVGRPVGWGAAFAYSLPGWYVWAALAPGIVRLGRAVPIRRGRLTHGLVFHVAAGALAALAHAALAVGVERLLGAAGAPAAGYGEALRLRLRIGSHLDVITYWAILLTSYALAYWRREQERELTASRAAAALAEARLELLRVQLDPHFLFNALNAIAGMVHLDPPAADRMIARLAELLRFSLDERGRQEVPLRDELRLLEAYAAIERVRFGKRLEISVQVEAELQDALVPSLLLQPLVENAIRHGIAPRPGPGRVQVTAARVANALEVVVRDDGVGLSSDGGARPAPHTADDGGRAPPGKRSGFGLDNTRARLAQLYGAAHRFDIVEGDAGGLLVRLTIPLRGAAARAREVAP
ncbi:MAG TPA: histidine kinase [Longimicrobiales bacterium]